MAVFHRLDNGFASQITHQSQFLLSTHQRAFPEDCRIRDLFYLDLCDFSL